MRFWICLTLTVMPTLAHSENVYQAQKVCWLSGHEYSPGAVVVAGVGAMVCSPDFVWVDTKLSPAGCLSDGQLSGVGDVHKGKTVDSSETVCTPAGTWENTK